MSSGPYYIRQYLSDMPWDYAQFDGEKFVKVGGWGYRVLSRAQEVWTSLPPELQDNDGFTYIVGPRGGFYDPATGAAVREADPS